MNLRHHQCFSLDFEAFIIHRDDMLNVLKFDIDKLPWRACVRNGKQMEWQWCASEQEALDWIDSFKNSKLQPIVD